MLKIPKKNEQKICNGWKNINYYKMSSMSKLFKSWNTHIYWDRYAITQLAVYNFHLELIVYRNLSEFWYMVVTPYYLKLSTLRKTVGCKLIWSTIFISKSNDRLCFLWKVFLYEQTYNKNNSFWKLLISN